MMFGKYILQKQPCGTVLYYRRNNLGKRIWTKDKLTEYASKEEALNMRSKIKATVRWFDNLSQEGMIRLPDGSSVYVNNDPCHGHLLMGGTALELKSGQPVLVEVYEDTTFRQVSKLEVV